MRKNEDQRIKKENEFFFKRRNKTKINEVN